LMTPIISRVCLHMSVCQNISQLKQQLCTDHCVLRGTRSNQHI